MTSGDDVGMFASIPGLELRISLSLPGLLTHDLVIAHHVTLKCPYAGCAECCSSLIAAAAITGIGLLLCRMSELRTGRLR